MEDEERGNFVDQLWIVMFDGMNQDLEGVFWNEMPASPVGH